MKLIEYLKETNTTPIQFARQIGTSVPTVRRYLNGSRKPNDAILPRIVKETNNAVTANDFWMPSRDDSGAALNSAGC